MSTKLLSYIFAATATLCTVQQANSAMNTTLWGIYSNNVMFSPKPVKNAYLELEYSGQTGPIDWYGYFDAPKFLMGTKILQVFGIAKVLSYLWNMSRKSL